MLDNATTRRLAVMNLALRGIEADFVDCMVALPGQETSNRRVLNKESKNLVSKPSEFCSNAQLAL